MKKTYFETLNILAREILPFFLAASLYIILKLLFNPGLFLLAIFFCIASIYKVLRVRFDFAVDIGTFSFIFSLFLATGQSEIPMQNISVYLFLILNLLAITLRLLHIDFWGFLWFMRGVALYSALIFVVFYVGGNESVAMAIMFGLLTYAIFLNRFNVIFNYPNKIDAYSTSIYYYVMSIVDMIAIILLYAAIYNVVGLKSEGGLIVGDVFASTFFSFVTWTTLGYGDITPTGYSRLFAAAEAFTGMLAMALLISGIVSIYNLHDQISRMTKDDS